MLVCSTKTSQSSSGNKRLKKSYGSDSVTSGHLNRKFDEKPANSSDISKRTTSKNFRRLENNLKHQNEAESCLESNSLHVRGIFCPWCHKRGIIRACQIKGFKGLRIIDKVILGIKDKWSIFGIMNSSLGSTLIMIDSHLFPVFFFL